MIFSRALRMRTGLIAVVGTLLLACRASAQFPPQVNPIEADNEWVDYDGDLQGDLEWSFTVWLWNDGTGPENPPSRTTYLIEKPIPGTQFWRSADTNRVPFGTPIGDPQFRQLESVSGYEPVNRANGRRTYAVTVRDIGGGPRHGWIQQSEELGDASRIEFARDTNRPIALGLPDEPRWLPRLNPGQENLDRSLPGFGTGTLVSFMGRPDKFSGGILALATATQGTLYGVGYQRDSGVLPGSGSDLGAYLFSINPDGSQMRTHALVGSNFTTTPEYSMTMTTRGLLFISRSRGPLHRYDPQTGLLTVIRITPALRGPIRELSDGNLYGTTGASLVVTDPNGESARVQPLGGTGLKQFEVGVVEDAHGWIYLVAQSGGDGNGGGILRCRKDGSEASVWFQFASLAGLAAEYLPAREFFTNLVKSPLCLARDGSLYGTMRERARNLVYRVAPDGAPTVLQFLRWDYPTGTFTNGLGGRTWVGAFSRGMVGGLSEGDDGHLYGVAQYEWNGNYPVLPAAVMRIRIPGGTVEMLSQDSRLGVLDSLDKNGPPNRGVPWVRGAEGVMYMGSSHGIVSMRPGKNGILPICRTDAGYEGYSDLSFLGSPLRDETGASYAVVPHGGAFHAGFVVSVQGDGAQARILHSFSGGAGDVLRPSGALVMGDGGWIYGTSHQGDAYEFSPQLWRLHRDTGDMEVLASLPGRDDGRATLPYGLLRSRSGVIYGTTPYGGAADLGTLYRYDPGENRITVLHEFGVSEADRWQPWPELLEGTDGWIYGLGTAENFALGSPDGWFRIAADGSGYQILGKLERPAGSVLQISGGLTEASDHRFYCVRALPLPSMTNAPVTGQILRLTLPEAGTEPSRVEVVFETAAGEEPFLSPVGRLMELPSGELVGLGRSQETAIYSVTPTSGAVRRVHRWGMRGTARWFSIVDRFAGVVRDAEGAFIVPVTGALVRVDLQSASPTPEAIPNLKFSGTYGEYTPELFAPQIFTQAFFLSGARNLPSGVQFDRAATTYPFGHIQGTYLETGRIRSEVYSSDGSWPAVIVTNYVDFEIQPRQLTLKGPNAIWVTGEPKPLPEGLVMGIVNSDLAKVTVAWKTEEGASGRPGTYPIVPEIQDPDGRLQFYKVFILEGRLTVVDRETRVVLDGGVTYLEFPPLADHRFYVSEATSLQGPWNLIHSTRGRASVVNRYLLNPPADGREHYYRIEANY